MTFKKTMAVLSVALALAGCADHADKVKATYVSPLQYQDYSCRQIRAEVGRVSHKANELAGVQDKTATGDAWATGVGVVLFWPSLFFIAHDDVHVELAELKGRYDALEEAAIQKDCNIAKQMKIAEAEAAKRKEIEKADAAVQSKTNE